MSLRLPISHSALVSIVLVATGSFSVARAQQTLGHGPMTTNGLSAAVVRQTPPLEVPTADAPPPAIVWQPLGDEPIAYTGHGAMFDDDGNEIEPTAEFIARARSWYRRELLTLATPTVRLRQERLLESVTTSARHSGLELIDARTLGDAAALELLSVEVPAPRSRDLRSKLAVLEAHRTLQALSERRPSPAELLEFDIASWRADLPQLTSEHASVVIPALSGAAPPASASAFAFATDAQGQAYRDQCAAAGVPIPPDWGASGWVSRGELTEEFISTELEAEVFTWESASPAGMCIALPRWNADGRARFLGIICLSERWSKACFWDNQSGGEQFFPARDETRPLSDFGGGADLTNVDAGKCTACHAGRNPFVIHPGTALGLPNLAGLPLEPDDWYEPIVRPDWPQNPGPLATSGACSSCHRDGGSGGAFPQINRELRGYCNNVLGPAIERTMPTPDPGALAGTAHPNALLALCSAEPPGETPPTSTTPSTTPTPTEGFGTESDVYVQRAGDGSRRRLWGTRQYADVNATADAYCRALGFGGASSHSAERCGEDESSYMRYNPDTSAWESKASGSRNNPPGECLYALLSEVSCSG